jgi:hypothetical protein
MGGEAQGKRERERERKREREREIQYNMHGCDTISQKSEENWSKR